MKVFKYPFRFVNGKVGKLEAESAEHDAQVITTILQTGKGELPLRPSFGTLSPEFSSVDTPGLMYSLASYYPNITINNVHTRVNPENQMVEIRINFSNPRN